MGKIRQLREDQIVNGGSQEHIYPITHTKAVYSKDRESLQDIIDSIREGNFLKDGSIKTRHLKDKAVTTSKLDDDSVDNRVLAIDAVETENILDNAVLTSKIADQNVTKEKIADQSVDNSKLSPSAVTYDKLKDKSVITEKLNDRAVTTEKVEEKAITNTKLGDQSVDGRVVREASIEGKHIGNNAVSTSKIASRSVTNEKIAYNSVSRAELTPDVRNSIDKKADAEQVNNSLYNLEKKIGDRFVIEGDVTNLPDEEDLTSVKESEHDVLKLADRSYAPYNFSGKGYKILRRNIKPVSIAVTKIRVESVPLSDGTLSFTINGKETQIAVSATTDNTTALVAQKVAVALQDSMTEYDVSIDASLITLTRKSGGSVTPSVFSANTTGIVCTITDSTKRESRNLLTTAMLSKANTIYEIRYDFDLNGETIEMKEGCTLKFNGGSLGNGTIIGNETSIDAKCTIFTKNILIRGNWKLNEISTSLFKDIDNNTVHNMSFLASGNHVKTVIIEGDNIECNIVSDYLFKVKSNTHIYIKGTVSYGNQASDARDMFAIESASNVIIEGGHLKGNIEYSNDGETSNGISVWDSTNVLLKNISVEKFTRDGIYILSNIDAKATITLDGVVSLYNQRQAISITGCNNVILRNSKFSYTGTIKKGSLGRGLDIEPNVSYRPIGDISIYNCEFLGNQDVALGCANYNNIEFGKFYIENSVLDGIGLGKFKSAELNNISINKKYYNNEYNPESVISFADVQNVIMRNVISEQSAIALNSNNAVMENCNINFDGTKSTGIARIFIHLPTNKENTDIQIRNCVFNLNNGIATNRGVVGRGSTSNEEAIKNAHAVFTNCTFNCNNFNPVFAQSSLYGCIINATSNCNIVSSNVAKNTFSIINNIFNINSVLSMLTYGTYDENRTIKDFIWANNTINTPVETYHVPLSLDKTIIDIYNYKDEVDKINKTNSIVNYINSKYPTSVDKFLEKNGNIATSCQQAGWYRFATIENNTNSLFSISRSFSTVPGEAYLFNIIKVDSKYCIKTISGIFDSINNQYITKIRIVDGKYLEFYYISSRRNSVSVNGSNLKLNNPIEVSTASSGSSVEEFVVCTETGPSSSRINLNPNQIGFVYFDTSLNKPIYWTGSKWVDAAGLDV